MTENKVATYLGFCIRSSHIVLGWDNIEKYRCNIYLFVADANVSERTMRHLQRESQTRPCPLLICRVDLAEQLHKPGCMVVAITDEHLASAILASNDKEYELYRGGNL